MFISDIIFFVQVPPHFFQSPKKTQMQTSSSSSSSSTTQATGSGRGGGARDFRQFIKSIDKTLYIKFKPLQTAFWAWRAGKTSASDPSFDQFNIMYESFVSIRSGIARNNNNNNAMPHSSSTAKLPVHSASASGSSAVTLSSMHSATLPVQGSSSSSSSSLSMQGSTPRVLTRSISDPSSSSSSTSSSPLSTTRRRSKYAELPPPPVPVLTQPKPKTLLFQMPKPIETTCLHLLNFTASRNAEREEHQHLVNDFQYDDFVDDPETKVPTITMPLPLSEESANRSTTLKSVQKEINSILAKVENLSEKEKSIEHPDLVYAASTANGSLSSSSSSLVTLPMQGSSSTLPVRGSLLSTSSNIHTSRPRPETKTSMTPAARLIRGLDNKRTILPSSFNNNSKHGSIKKNIYEVDLAKQFDETYAEYRNV